MTKKVQSITRKHRRRANIILFGICHQYDSHESNKDRNSKSSDSDSDSTTPSEEAGGTIVNGLQNFDPYSAVNEMDF